MTPAIKLLDKLKTTYQVHQYIHDEHAVSYGLEAAEKLAIDAKLIFKTIVVETENNQMIVAIIPVEKQLNLKALAKTISCKKIKMADPKKVQTTTGYVLGGVSPLGQKKKLQTVIDCRAEALNSIYVSGGKRGLEIEVAPDEIIKITHAHYSDITC